MDSELKILVTRITIGSVVGLLLIVWYLLGPLGITNG